MGSDTSGPVDTRHGPMSTKLIYKYLIHENTNVRDQWRAYLKQCYSGSIPNTNSTTSPVKFPDEIKIPHPPTYSKDEKKRLLLEETWPVYVKQPTTYTLEDGSKEMVEPDSEKNNHDKTCEVRETSILNEATMYPETGLLTYLLDEPVFEEKVGEQLKKQMRYFIYKGGGESPPQSTPPWTTEEEVWTRVGDRREKRIVPTDKQTYWYHHLIYTTPLQQYIMTCGTELTDDRKKKLEKMARMMKREKYDKTLFENLLKPVRSPYVIGLLNQEKDVIISMFYTKGDLPNHWIRFKEVTFEDDIDRQLYAKFVPSKVPILVSEVVKQPILDLLNTPPPVESYAEVRRQSRCPSCNKERVKGTRAPCFSLRTGRRGGPGSNV